MEAGIPKCPDHLDETAQKEWARVSRLLLAMKVLTEADYIALGNLCQAYSTMVAAQRQLNKTEKRVNKFAALSRVDNSPGEDPSIQ